MTKPRTNASTAPRTVEDRKKAEDLVVRVVRMPIQLDAVDYAPGDEIELTAAQAESLDKVNALEPITA